MKFIKKFEQFKINEEAPSPSPKKEPGTSPTIAPDRPKTNPGEKPQRPGPFRRDKPKVSPDPKAKARKLKKASAEQVAESFIRELSNKGESVKKYIGK